MDYKRGKPAKTRKGRPSVAEVKSFIDKREDEKKKIRLSSLESKITEVRKNSPKLKNDSKSNFKDSIKKINSKLGKLAGYVRRAVVRIGVIEKKLLDIEKIIPPKEKLTVIDKRLTNLEKKVTIIKNIIKNQQSSVGQKSNQDNLYKTLVKTNKLLLDIQKELVKSIKKETKDSGNRQRRESLNKSKKKLKEEESILEKSGKVINEGVKKVADKMLSPIKNIFDKVIDFLFTLGTGIVVNAVFKWLKNPENVEKVNGWFSWIKENWKWMAAAVGAIALLPVITTISGLIGPVGMIVGLLAKAVPLMVGLLLNPLFLKAMLAVGAGILIYKGGEFLLKKARDLVTGGEDFSAAHSQLDQQLADAGMDKGGRTARGRGRAASKKGITGRNEDQEKIFQEVKKKREALYALKDEMNVEIKEKQSKLEIIPTPRGRKKQGYVNPNEQARKKVDMEVREDYKTKISDIITPTKIEERKMGGPVTAGNPYIVGERGPELYVPNFDGKIINNLNTEKIINNLNTEKIINNLNLNTEKIYNIISSKKKKVSNIKTMELPPIFNNDTNIPEVSVPSGPATKVPSISSFDASNPYIKSSLDIYGIMV
jgi:hypothetical protein